MSGGVPNIFDSGIDDNSIAHLLDHSEPGAWAAVLPFCVNICILPDALDEQPLDPVEGGEDTAVPAFVPDLLSPFHNPPDSPEVQQEDD